MANGGSGGIRGAFEAQMESMTPRDRFLLAGLVCFFGVVGISLMLFFVRSKVGDQRDRLEQAQKNLALVEGMQKEFAAAQARVERAEAGMEQYKGQQASAYFERVAQDEELREKFTVIQQGSEASDGLRKTDLRVDLKKISVQDAVEFVHTIETGGYPLTIDLARFKTVATPEGKMLDVTLEVAAYQIEEG